MSTYISISEMAKLHGITRQTLIHYDNIDSVSYTHLTLPTNSRV